MYGTTVAIFTVNTKKYRLVVGLLDQMTIYHELGAYIGSVDPNMQGNTPMWSAWVAGEHGGHAGHYSTALDGAKAVVKSHQYRTLAANNEFEARQAMSYAEVDASIEARQAEAEHHNTQHTMYAEAAEAERSAALESLSAAQGLDF